MAECLACLHRRLFVRSSGYMLLLLAAQLRFVLPTEVCS